MPAGGIHQLETPSRRRPGTPGMVALVSQDNEHTFVKNSDPQAKELYTLTIDTATDAEDYSVILSDPAATEVQVTAGTSSSTTTVALAIATAWNQDSIARGIAVAAAAAAVVTFTAVHPGVAFTLAEGDNAAKMSLVNTTNAASASAIPFGRGVIALALDSLDGTQLGILAKSSALTAQVDTWTLAYDADVEVYARIEVDGQVYESLPFAMATDLATVTAALDAAIDAAVPAATVVATNTATTVIITGEVAGKPFKSSIHFGVGADTATATKVSTEGAANTDINKALAGIATYAYDEQQASQSTEAAEYGPNRGVDLLRRGKIWVESAQTIALGDPVYIELDGTGANAGKFYNTSSSTRVKLTNARWIKDEHAASGAWSASDGGVAMLALSLPV